MQEEADEALVARCRKGDGGGFATLVGRYEKVLFNLAYRMLGDPDEARDVAQAAFLKALENLDRFDPKFRFYSWLYRIAMTEALDVIGHRGRQTELTDVHAADDDPARDAQTADLGVTTQNYLGKSQWPDPYLDGNLDDFRLYSQAMTAGEIAALANPAAGVPLQFAIVPGYGQATFTWLPNATTNYTVKRSTTSGGPYTTIVAGLTNLTYTDTGLSNGVT